MTQRSQRTACNSARCGTCSTRTSCYCVKNHRRTQLMQQKLTTTAFPPPSVPPYRETIRASVSVNTAVNMQLPSSHATYLQLSPHANWSVLSELRNAHKDMYLLLSTCKQTNSHFQHPYSGNDNFSLRICRLFYSGPTGAHIWFSGLDAASFPEMVHIVFISDTYWKLCEDKTCSHPCRFWDSFDFSTFSFSSNFNIDWSADNSNNILKSHLIYIDITTS